MGTRSTEEILASHKAWCAGVDDCTMCHPVPPTVIHEGGKYSRLPATVYVINKIGGLWGGLGIHGDTATEIDVELPDMFKAASFAQVNSEWTMRLRDPITDPSKPVVWIITKDQECGRLDCWCEPGQYVE